MTLVELRVRISIRRTHGSEIGSRHPAIVVAANDQVVRGHEQIADFAGPKWARYAIAQVDGAIYLAVKTLATAPPISRAIATPLGLDRAPRDGVCGCWEAVGKWPAGATVESLA